MSSAIWEVTNFLLMNLGWLFFHLTYVTLELKVLDKINDSVSDWWSIGEEIRNFYKKFLIKSSLH
jgi:hypothetical protein